MADTCSERDLECFAASMGPRSDNRGYGRRRQRTRTRIEVASMGPRSDNRGYALPGASRLRLEHASMGPRSDNRGYANCAASRGRPLAEPLQWVHGPITVVMADAGRADNPGSVASMGPRSDNRGYRELHPICQALSQPASMGPRSDNRGYEIQRRHGPAARRRLQWVHGLITVVMVRTR